MGKMKALKRAMSIGLALIACSNMTLAGTGGRLLGETVITAFAEDAVNPVQINRSYLLMGETIEVNCQEGLTLKYFKGDEYIGEGPITMEYDLCEKWLRVEAYSDDTLVGEDKIYCSNLPVIYIDTKDGAMPPPDDKSVKVTGTLHIQDNKQVESPVYSGDMTLQGRGNTTWGWPKKPYKIKLDKKTDLYGFGKNKKWVLLANYQDESLLRNTTAANLSKELGLTTMETTWTDVVINGEYAGNYQLCEQVGIAKDRVDMTDWESVAEDAADAIAAANPEIFNTDKKIKKFEDQMTEDLSWITSDSVIYTKTDPPTTFKVSDYYSKLKKLGTDGGYLFESSEEYDEESKFMTRGEDSGLKIMMKSPEFLNTNPEMWAYVQKLWKDFENAYCSEDGYTVIDGEPVHYTELADFDSMVSYWLLMEIMGNDDARYKSRYVYKASGKPLTFGPPWDFDTGAGSIIVSSEISDSPTGWKVSLFDEDQNFYREFLDDPLFIAAATERYWQIRPYLEDVFKEDGALDADIAYLSASGAADSALWDRNEQWPGLGRGIEADTDIFKNYMRTRLAWLDEQFGSDDALIESTRTESAAPYTRDDSFAFTVENSVQDTFTEFASADAAIRTGSSAKVEVAVGDTTTAELKVYVNGKSFDTVEPVNGKAAFEIPNDSLYGGSKKNVISVIGKDSTGATTGRNFTTIVENAGVPVKAPEFKNQNLILSGQIGLNLFIDLSGLTDAEKAASYMEFVVNGKSYTDNFDESFKNQSGQYYGFTCYLSSIQMADEVTAIYHYGNSIASTSCSVKGYIEGFDTYNENNPGAFSEEAVSLVHAIADYGHYAQPFLAPSNNWTIGKEHVEMTKFYTESYNHDALAEAASVYKPVYEDNNAEQNNDVSLSYSLSLNAETTVNVIVKPGQDYTGSIKAFLGTEPLELGELKNGRYTINFSDIAAHRLSDSYGVTVTTDSGDIYFSVSALSYAYTVLSNSVYDDTAKNAVSSLLKYYEATAAYRSSINN